PFNQTASSLADVQRGRLRCHRAGSVPARALAAGARRRRRATDLLRPLPGPRDAVHGELVDQRGAGDAELARGVGPIAGALLQRRDDPLALAVRRLPGVDLDRGPCGRRRLAIGRVEEDVARPDLVAVADEARPLHNGAQLADVAGPVVTHERVERRGAE